MSGVSRFRGFTRERTNALGPRAFCVILAASCPALSPAAAPTVTATVSPTSATVGQPVTVTVRVASPDLARVVVDDPFRADDKQSTWVLRQRVRLPDEPGASSDPAGARVGTIRYTVSTFETGRVALPAVSASLPPGSGASAAGTSETASASPGAVNIASVLPATLGADEPADLRGAKPPVAVPIPAWAWLTAAGLTAVALALLWKLFGAALRRRVAALAGPPPTLESLALAEFDRLERDRLPESRRYREFATRLTAITRGYMGRVFGFDAMEMTTTELLAKLDDTLAEGRDEAAAADIRERVERLLADADLVKFARHEPENSACRRALDSARSVVTLAARPPEPPPSATAAAGTPPPPPSAPASGPAPTEAAA